MDFPENYTVLLRGPPGSGKGAFCLSLVKRYLEDGRNVVFITTEKTPEELERTLMGFGLNTELEKLYFVDGSLWSPEEKERWVASGRKRVIGIQKDAAFEALVKVSKGLEELGESRIFFDSLSSFFFRRELEDSLKALDRLNEGIKERFGFAFYTIQEELHPPHVYSRLESMVDGVIEMRYKDVEGVIQRQFRIKFLKGLEYESGWKAIQFERGGLWISPAQ